MSGTIGNIEWYLARDGQQHGPLTATELDKFIDLGHLRPTDLLWRAGFDDWRPAADVFPPLPPNELKIPEAPTATAAQSAPKSTSGDHPTATNKSEPAQAAGEAAQSAEPQGARTQATQVHAAPTARSSDLFDGNPQRTRQPQVQQPRDVDAARPQGPANDAAGAAAQRPLRRRTMQPGPEQPGLGHPGQTHPRLSQPSMGQPGHDPTGLAQSDLDQSGQRRPRPGSPDPGQPASGQPISAPSGPRGAEPAGNSLGRQQPRPQPAAVHARPDDNDDDAFLDDEGGGRGGWLMVAAALFVFVILGAGGLFAYNNQSKIAAFYADVAGKSKTSDVAVVRAPTEVARAPIEPRNAKATPVVAPLNETAPVATQKVETKLTELPILKSKLWQFAQKEFSEWTQKQMQKVQQFSDQDKSKEEANKYLVDSFVRFRRENAAVALLASADSLAEVAESFVESLQALTANGSNACYAFISNGESTPEVANLFFEPSIGPKLEAQMLAILKAIASGKTQPNSSRQPPTADDFNMLSKELGKRGWSSADLRLFSNPNELSKAKPAVVCRLVTEWFATQTQLGNRTSRDQLIAASLRPVIGG